MKAQRAKPSMFTIRPANPQDSDAIKALAVESGLFSEDDVGFFDEILEGTFEGSMPGHSWRVAQGEDGSCHAAAYFAPEPFADRMWNLYFLAVAPARHGQGLGRALVEHIEADLCRRGEDQARTLVVETSSTDVFATTRSFYVRRGFVEEARIRQFYGPDDDKVVFWKSLCGAS